MQCVVVSNQRCHVRLLLLDWTERCRARRGRHEITWWQWKDVLQCTHTTTTSTYHTHTIINMKNKQVLINTVRSVHCVKSLTLIAHTYCSTISEQGLNPNKTSISWITGPVNSQQFWSLTTDARCLSFICMHNSAINKVLAKCRHNNMPLPTNRSLGSHFIHFQYLCDNIDHRKYQASYNYCHWLITMALSCLVSR